MWRQWNAILPHNVCQFHANTWGQQLLITSRSGFLRPFSDNSKDESRDIIHAHMQNTLIYSNISEKKNKTEAQRHILGKK